MGVFGVTSGGGGGGGAGGGGIGGSTGATDNALLRADGAGGATVQGSTATLGDAGAIGGISSLVASGVITSGAGYLVNDGPGGDEKVQVAASFLLASDAHVKFYNDADISSGSADVGLKRRTAGVLELTNGSSGNGALGIGGATCRGFSSSAMGASTTELPSDKDWSFHKNTTTGVVQLAFNDGGAIKAIALA